MVWEVLRLNVSFVCFRGRKNVSVGRAGIDPLTVRYTHFSLCCCQYCLIIQNVTLYLLFEQCYGKHIVYACLLAHVLQ